MTCECLVIALGGAIPLLTVIRVGWPGFTISWRWDVTCKWMTGSAKARAERCLRVRVRVVGEREG
jgi:hypothetical protein